MKPEMEGVQRKRLRCNAIKGMRYNKDVVVNERQMSSLHRMCGRTDKWRTLDKGWHYLVHTVSFRRTPRR